jgi:hypothetical protein
VEVKAVAKLVVPTLDDAMDTRVVLPLSSTAVEYTGGGGAAQARCGVT